MTVFPIIVGCGRSGTTLVRSMFDSHPDLAIPQESYFVASLVRRRAVFERRAAFRTEAFLAALAESHRFAAWGLPIEVVAQRFERQAPRTVPDAIRSVYALYAEREGKTRYGDKTPSYVLNIAELSTAFPEVRFIHVIRDGRDVACSLLDVGFGPSTIEGAAVHWRRWVSRGRRAGRRVGPDRYREIRYEALLDDPEALIKDLCGFVELDFAPSMLRYFERADRIRTGFPRPGEHRHLSKPPSKGIRDWRRELTSDAVARFEAIAGGTLETLGYGRAAKPSRLTAASAMGRAFGCEARRVSLAARAIVDPRYRSRGRAPAEASRG